MSPPVKFKVEQVYEPYSPAVKRSLPRHAPESQRC